MKHLKVRQIRFVDAIHAPVSPAVKSIEKKMDIRPIDFWGLLGIMVLVGIVMFIGTRPVKAITGRLPIGEYQNNLSGELGRIADNYNIPTNMLENIAKCESKFNPSANGDGRFKSRGMFQISAFYHKGITNEQAYNWRWAADYTAKQISLGNGLEWSCYKQLMAVK